MKLSITIAYTCILVFSLVFTIDVIIHELNVFYFYLLMCLIFFFIPVIWSNASVKATREITDKANSNAVLSFINIMGCFVGLLLVAATATLAKPLSMTLVFLVTAIALAVIGIRNHRKYPV